MDTMRSRTRRVLLAASLLVLLLFVACGRQPTRWDQAQTNRDIQETPAVAEEALPGRAFNPFFPDDEGDFDVVYAQEKQGFAQAKLKKERKDVAVLSVFDTASDPTVAEKYEQSSETLAGYPTVAIGSNGTAILVNERFQVQVRSSDETFGPSDREAWLQKFDLDGLASLP